MSLTSCLRRLFLAFVLAFGVWQSPAVSAGGTVALARDSRPTQSATAVCAADPAPLFAGVLRDTLGNRSRLIQMSFIFILVGIFILWKK